MAPSYGLALSSFIGIKPGVVYVVRGSLWNYWQPPSRTKTKDSFIKLRSNYSKVFTVGMESFFRPFKPRPWPCPEPPLSLCLNTADLLSLFFYQFSLLSSLCFEQNLLFRPVSKTPGGGWPITSEWPSYTCLDQNAWLVHSSSLSNSPGFDVLLRTHDD